MCNLIFLSTNARKASLKINMAVQANIGGTSDADKCMVQKIAAVPEKARKK